MSKRLPPQYWELSVLLREVLLEWTDCWCKRSIGYTCPPCELRARIRKVLK